MNTELDYINLCKSRIEKKFGFEPMDGSLRQRDLEYIAEQLELQSGVRLSLSTLKRIWKKDYDQTPHSSTLDALVSLIDYKDWQTFKRNQPQAGGPTVDAPSVSSGRSKSRRMLIPVAVVFIVVFGVLGMRRQKDEANTVVIKGPVLFTGDKTVSQGVPNTVIFKYDLSNVKADSFFFQQSWNGLEKVKIDPEDHVYTNTYYYPGFHKAKLIANDSIISRFRVHVTTDGWFPLVRNNEVDDRPVYVRGDLTSRGLLHISSDALKLQGISTDREFMLSYFNVRNFENTNSDNFEFKTFFALEKNPAITCPAMEVVIICEVHIFYVRMMSKGCERDISIKMGERVHEGRNNDLSAFGRDLTQMQNLRINVVNKKAAIYLDDNVVHEVTFQKDFGKVVGVVYNFIGAGMVDEVSMKNGEGKSVLHDTF